MKHNTYSIAEDKQFSNEVHEIIQHSSQRFSLLFWAWLAAVILIIYLALSLITISITKPLPTEKGIEYVASDISLFELFMQRGGRK